MTIKVQEHKKFICLLLTALLIGSLCCGCGTSKEVMAESVADIDADTDSPEGQSADDDIVQDEAGSTAQDEAAVQHEAANVIKEGTENAVQGDAESSVQGDGGNYGQSVSGNAMSEDIEVNARREPVKVKGIYVSGPVAGIDRMDTLIELVDQTELNAMVIDIKNDEGRVTYKMQSEQCWK